MTLFDFYKETTKKYKLVTDKGTKHSYIQHYYSEKFSPLKDANISILEIGIYRGASLKLWREWFTNASIYGLDKGESFVKVCNKIKGVNVILGDAYTDEVCNKFDDKFFDIIIEDGLHTVESQIYTMKKWTSKLKPNGVLIIEDIQREEYIQSILNAVPTNNEYNIKVYDFRKNINRFDDIIIEVTRLEKN